MKADLHFKENSLIYADVCDKFQIQMHILKRVFPLKHFKYQNFEEN